MIAFPSNWILFFPIAFCIFVSLQVAQGGMREMRNSRSLLAVRCLMVVLFAFGLISAGLRANLLGAIWLGLVGGLLLAFAWKSRDLRRSALLLTALHATHAEEQHYVASVFSAANRGWVRRKAVVLRRFLSGGVPWWFGLEMSGVARSGYECLETRSRAQYGPQTTFDECEGLGVEAEADRLFARLFILAGLWSIGPLLIGFRVYIANQLEQMFNEFGMDLPDRFQAAMLLADPRAGGLGIPVLLGYSLILALLVVATAAWLFPGLMRVPGLRWLRYDYDRTLTFAALTRACSREPNLTVACRQAVELVSLDYMAQRLARTADLLENGLAPEAAFLGGGLLNRREVGPAAKLFASPGPAWSLRQFTRWRVDRMMQRYSIIVQWMLVAIVLLFACPIALLAVGFMEALVQLILSLA